MIVVKSTNPRTKESVDIEISTAGSTLQEAIKKYGERLVMHYYEKGVFETARRRVLNYWNKKQTSQEEIQHIMKSWTPNTPEENKVFPTHATALSELASDPEKRKQIEEDLKGFLSED